MAKGPKKKEAVACWSILTGRYFGINAEKYLPFIEGWLIILSIVWVVLNQCFNLIHFIERDEQSLRSVLIMFISICHSSAATNHAHQ